MTRLHCFACHEFLTTEPGLRPTRRDCLRCHTAQGIHAPMGDHGGAMEMACASCHKPHAATRPGRRSACTSCHKEMKKGGLHRRAGHQRCIDCHKPHTWKAEEPACLALPRPAPAATPRPGLHRLSRLRRRPAARPAPPSDTPPP